MMVRGLAMKSRNKYFILIAALLVLINSTVFPSDSLAGTNFYRKANSENVVNRMKSIRGNGQLILVTASGYRKSSVTVQTFSKDKHGKWKRLLIMRGITGKYGFSHQKHEGDKKAPTGKYSITRAFGRYNNPGTKLPYHKITGDDVWVDNIHSRYYNTLQSKRRTRQYSESMNIPQYNYGFVINYNTKRIRGEGSAVFFHISHGSYTLGCTAVSRDNILSILKWLDPKKKPVIVQSVLNELNMY